MFNNDFTKLFDPQQAAKQWQNMLNMQQTMQSSQQGMETMKQVSQLWASTLSTCTEKQMQYCQTSMEDCLQAVKELSAAKGMDEYVQKQAKLSQTYAEKAQSTAQEMASQWQQTQTQCTEMLSKQMMQGMEWSKNATTATSSSTTTSSK